MGEQAGFLSLVITSIFLKMCVCFSRADFDFSIKFHNHVQDDLDLTGPGQLFAVLSKTLLWPETSLSICFSFSLLPQLVGYFQG